MPPFNGRDCLDAIVSPGRNPAGFKASSASFAPTCYSSVTQRRRDTGIGSATGQISEKRRDRRVVGTARLRQNLSGARSGTRSRHHSAGQQSFLCSHETLLWTCYADPLGLVSAGRCGRSGIVRFRRPTGRAGHRRHRVGRTVSRSDRTALPANRNHDHGRTLAPVGAECVRAVRPIPPFTPRC